MTRDLPVPGCALAIAAHPDDAEFGCWATLAKWAAAGSRIVHLVCTDGSKGTWDEQADTATLVATRQEEQREANRALGGAGEVVFLGFVDGELESGRHQRERVAYWIRAVRPDVVLAHDPWRRYRLHPDHRHAGFLATDGIVAARDPHFFPHHDVAPHRPSTLLLWEADQPDHVEDASGFVDVKLATLLAHRSQYRSTMHIDDAGSVAERDAFRLRVVDRLRDHGSLGGVDLGEAFAGIRHL